METSARGRGGGGHVREMSIGAGEKRHVNGVKNGQRMCTGNGEIGGRSSPH